MQWSEFSFVLRPSALGGVGVFATHDINAGALVFCTSFDMRILRVQEIPKDLLQYCIYLNDEEVLCPQRFDRMEIGWYINHSEKPNIERRDPIRNAGITNKAETIKDMNARNIYAVTDIKAGDEILINYNSLNEPEHLKEDYYKANTGRFAARN